MCEYDAAGSYKRLFIYGNYIDEVLFSIGFSKTYYYVHDHLYSPVAIADPNNGAAIERYEYDAYGRCCVLDPDFSIDADGLSDYDNPYLFTGRRWDILNNGSLKIQYSRNRYYDHHTGRFLSHDPLGITPNPPNPNIFDIAGQYKDGLSLYEYVKSKPVVYTDGLGLYPIPLPPPNWDSWVVPPYGGYDWWENPLDCVTPCKWRKDGDVSIKYAEYGCEVKTASLPVAPGCGAALAIIAIGFEGVSPQKVVCDGFLSVHHTCQCRITATRKCIRKCCNKDRGVHTQKKKFIRAYVKYGEAQYDKILGLICSCNPSKMIGYWAIIREDLNEAIDCKCLE